MQFFHQKSLLCSLTEDLRCCLTVVSVLGNSNQLTLAHFKIDTGKSGSVQAKHPVQPYNGALKTDRYFTSDSVASTQYQGFSQHSVLLHPQC